jgi:hypothetical protein
MSTKKIDAADVIAIITLCIALISGLVILMNWIDGVFHPLWAILFLFLIVLLIWAATVVGKMAKRYGRNYWSWFWVSLLLLWPFWAILLLCALGKTDEKKRKDIEEDEIIRIETRKKYETYKEE